MIYPKLHKCLQLSSCLTLFFLYSSYLSAQTVYLTSKDGNFASEKWMSITTGINGTGTLVWAQSPGAIPCGTTNGGLLTDEVIDLSSYCGQTLYINAYDRYADSWDGTTYELWTEAGGTGTLLANNGGASPDDLTDSDTSSAFCDPQSAELEQSEAFTVPACPCTAPQATFTVSPDCGNAQFYIDVEVTSLGDASAVDISDGTINYVTSVGLGTYQVGPFTYATNQQIDVLGAPYGGCDVASSLLTESCVCTNSPVFSHAVNTLDCSGLTYSMDVTISSYGDGVSADIYVDNVLVQASASLAVPYTFSGYSLGSHDIRVEAIGSGTIQCNQQQTITAFCNGADAWSLTAPSILNTCSNGDLSVASIDGPTDFGLFCNSGTVSGFGNNFIRPCAAGFDNTTDYTDLWYQVDLPDGTDEMTLQVNGLGLGEYVGYTLHTAGPLSSSSDFGVSATNNMHCSFFSQTVTEHTITGLATYSTAPIYIRVLAVDPDQNAPCNTYMYPSFTICASAPQPNDQCNTSLDITTNNGGAAQSGDLSAASDEGIACLDGVSGADLWYSISSILSTDPNYNGPYQVQVKADGPTGDQMIVQLINGCYSCPTISVLASDTLTFASPDSTDFGGYILSGGISNYYIRIVEYRSSASFTIEGKLKVANDECTYFNQFTTNFRLWDGTNPVVQLVDMDFSSNGDLYYQFSSLLSAPSYSGSVDLTFAGLTTNESVQVEIYERSPLYATDCDALQLVGSPLVISTDGTYTYDCLNQFEGNYLLRVVNVGSSIARFDLSAEPSDVAPLNDQCSTIWNGSAITFEGAAFDILSAPVVSDFTTARECDPMASDCGGVNLTASKDLWFHFTVPTNNCPNIANSTTITDVTLNYNANSAFRDAYVFVYTDCDANTLVDCSGSLDGAGEDFYVSGLIPGTTYLVRVKPSSLNSILDYSFTMRATLGPERPCNDIPTSAHALGALQSGLDRSTCLNGPFSARGASSSVTPASGKDVWLSFVAPDPANGQSYQIPESYVNIYLQSLSGSGIPYFLTLRVYDEVTASGSVGVPLGETSVGSGNSTTTNTNGDAWFSLGHLTPGETYYIRISHNQSDVEEVLYDLCLFDAATQNPCAQTTIPIADGVECSDDCSKYYRVQLTQDAPSGYYRFEAIGNNGVDVNMNMYYQPNETLGTNTGDITDVDQPCGVQSILPKEDQGALADPGSCNGGTGQYAIFNLIGGSASLANMYYLHVYDNNTLLGCGGLDLCQVNVLGPYSTLALAQAGGTPDEDCFSSLPVDLLSFEATALSRRNKLTWKVAQEVDVQEYVIQRSKDGQLFEQIDMIAAQSNSLDMLGYVGYDDEPISAAYYRLLIRDLDGSTQYSSVIYLERNVDDPFILSPNPVRDRLVVAMKGAQVNSGVILDALGNTVQLIDPSTIDRGISVTDLSAGVYVVQFVDQNGQVRSYRFTKLD